MNESKNLPRRRPLAFHPVSGPGGGGGTRRWSSRPFLSPNPCLFPRVPIHGADIDGLSERKQGGWRAAAGCAAMTCVGVGERGTHGKEGGGRIRGEKGGLGDDGRRHPSKGCRPALLLLLLPACLWQACMHVASALCRHVPGRPSSSPGAHSEAREGAAQKHKPGVLLPQRAGARPPQAAAACASAPARPYSLVHTPLAPLSCTYPIRSNPFLSKIVMCKL